MEHGTLHWLFHSCSKSVGFFPYKSSTVEYRIRIFTWILCMVFVFQKKTALQTPSGSLSDGVSVTVATSLRVEPETKLFSITVTWILQSDISRRYNYEEAGVEIPYFCLSKSPQGQMFMNIFSLQQFSLSQWYICVYILFLRTFFAIFMSSSSSMFVVICIE